MLLAAQKIEFAFDMMEKQCGKSRKKTGFQHFYPFPECIKKNKRLVWE